MQSLRADDSESVCDHIVEILNSGVGPKAVYDALFLQSGELLMRQPGIVSLHAVTSTNAFNYAYRTAANDKTRKMILLQNAAFLPLFRQEMVNRNKVNERAILELEASEQVSGLDDIFGNVGKDSGTAAQNVLAFLGSGKPANELMDEARRFIFLKGNDSHDYKFSSAVLEDYYQVSPEWRDKYLAASVFKMRGESSKNNGLVERIRGALA